MKERRNLFLDGYVEAAGALHLQIRAMMVSWEHPSGSPGGQVM